ncbi:MAG: PHD zinc finger-containing protein [Amphiamblys sp. WSBS2006]|nr:MAG: PHD zinc finger-containing protein [Amphiamblys sp. WSBS2006]
MGSNQSSCPPETPETQKTRLKKKENRPREEIPYREIYTDWDSGDEIAVDQDMPEKPARESRRLSLFRTGREQEGGVPKETAVYFQSYTIEEMLPSFAERNYCLDETDSCWIQKLGKRKIEIDKEDFQTAMDIFEKVFFLLTKHVQRLLLKEGGDETASDACEICAGGTSTNNNAIVFCDGCNTKVHQECYGIGVIPDGPWFCMPCRSNVKNPPCVLCPNRNNALKRTKTNKWAHVLCAEWLPEMWDEGQLYHEVLPSEKESIEHRKSLVCVICRIQGGAPTQCSAKTCHYSYHPTCALACGLTMNRKTRESYCPHHTPAEDILNIALPETCVAFYKKTPHLFFLQKMAMNVPREIPVPPPENKTRRELDFVLPEYAVEKAKEKTGLPLEKLHHIARYWAVKRKDEKAPLIKELAAPQRPLSQNMLAKHNKTLGMLLEIEKILACVLKREALKKQRTKAIIQLSSIVCRPLAAAVLAMRDRTRDPQLKKYLEKNTPLSTVKDPGFPQSLLKRKTCPESFRKAFRKTLSSESEKNSRNFLLKNNMQKIFQKPPETLWVHLANACWFPGQIATQTVTREQSQIEVVLYDSDRTRLVVEEKDTTPVLSTEWEREEKRLCIGKKQAFVKEAFDCMKKEML